MDITSIRCESNKPHGVFDSCGSLVGAIDEEGVPYFHCHNCSTWWKLISDDDGMMVLKKLPNRTKFTFTNKLKVVEND